VLTSIFSFFSVGDFEFTPECVVFDLLNIRLMHGWLVDPQNQDAVVAIGNLSYNQLVEKIIASKQEGADPDLVSAGKRLIIHVNSKQVLYF